MLGGFHLFLLIGMGIVVIAALKADYNTRLLIAAVVIGLLVFYKMQQKRK